MKICNSGTVFFLKRMLYRFCNKNIPEANLFDARLLCDFDWAEKGQLISTYHIITLFLEKVDREALFKILRLISIVLHSYSLFIRHWYIQNAVTKYSHHRKSKTSCINFLTVAKRMIFYIIITTRISN